MTLDTIVQETARLLSQRSEKLVLAESCTCGLVASQLGQLPGISNSLCGSAVVYRADTKRRWLSVSKKTIQKYTTESHQVAESIALGVLKITPEANWAIGVVGHLGPDAPPDKDGMIYACIARRTSRGKMKIKDRIEYKLNSDGRLRRQQEAVEVVLTHLARLLGKKQAMETAAKE